MKPWRIVLIEWVDSKGVTDHWEYFDEIEPMPSKSCYAAGFLIEDGKEFKTVALCLNDTQVIGRMTIPAGCIKSMKILKKAKELK